MAVEIKVSYTGAGSGDGSKEKPFESGGIYFKASVSGVSAVKLIWQHKWIVGGYPIPENETTPEMWYGRDGSAMSPSFHPIRKTTLSMVEIYVWNQGNEDQVKVLQIWVMAAKDEPQPKFGVQCDDGIQQVTGDELNWLKENGHVEMVFPRPKFSGTRAELRKLLEDSEPVDPPTEPPDIHPDSKVSLQICHAPIHGFDYSVSSGRLRDSALDIAKMKSLGARAVNLWVYPQHLFHGTGNWDRLNPCAEWYTDFVTQAKFHGLTVVLKVPLWSFPSWFDQPGVPPRGSDRYKRHMDAHRQVAARINEVFNGADYIMVGNEPQLTCTVWPNAPIDGSYENRWYPETILEVTKDVLTLADYYTNFKLIGPAMSGAIGQVVSPGTFMKPSSFLSELVGSLMKYGYQWCGINAYQLDVFRKPTYLNYGKFYEELSKIYPLWISECGVARKNVPEDAAHGSYLEGLIEQTMVFSPQLFSFFIFRDFNDRGWGIIGEDESVDPVKENVLEHYFSDQPVPPPSTYTKVLPARVRAAEKIDCGIQLMHQLKDRVIEVELEFWSSIGGWDKDEGEFVHTGQSGIWVGGVPSLELGPGNSVAFNVWADLGFDRVDAVIVRSAYDIGALSIWTWPSSQPVVYSGFPMLKS